jgi:hypothetical protein
LILRRLLSLVRRPLVPALVVAAALASARGLHAQVPDVPVPTDSARIDSLEADSLAADTVDATAAYLEAQRAAGERTTALAPIGADGPRPALSRVVLTRDSLEWVASHTLGDLLQRVPGVYLWRGGWVGRPAPANFQGRGASSVEYSLDGVPHLALGPDSVAFDPALIALSLLERVEIERWPGLLRVHLHTMRHERLAPRSRIAAGRGDAGHSAYSGSLERRGRSGFGVSFGADIVDVPEYEGAQGSFSNTQLFGQVGYVPRPGLGVQFQFLRSTPERSAYAPTGAAAPTSEAEVGVRLDAQLRASLFGRADGLGPRLDLVYARSSWRDTLDPRVLEQSVAQGGAVFTLRAPTAFVSASAFNRSRWTPFDLQLSGGWTPAEIVTASIDARLQTHDGDRSSRSVAGRLGVRLPLGLHVTGGARLGRVVAAPSVLASPEQEITDLELVAGLERSWLSLEGGVHRTSEFAPAAYPRFLPVDTLRPLPRIDWLTASARLTPLSWITIDGWFSTPRGGLVPDGLPPEHAVLRGTFRSSFRRTFPSGALQLKLQLGLEHWGAGVLGLDPTGAPVLLEPSTFVRSLVQLELAGFQAFWERVNLTQTSASYVPGFVVPPYGDTFGIRWSFTN